LRRIRVGFHRQTHIAVTRQFHRFTRRNARPLQARDVGHSQRMEVHPMPAFVHERDACGLEVRADHFHRRNPFRKHQIFRRQFSGRFHCLQYPHQFGMQRARLFLAALALCHWNGIKRIGHVQMQITPPQRIDFTATQSGVQREQIE